MDASISPTYTLRFSSPERALEFANSYTRLPALIRLHPRMDYAAWLAALGEHWSGCDNISAFLSQLRALLPRSGPARPMMTPEEQAAWDALPETVTIYRGARRTALGASWSLDRDVAASFPFRLRYTDGGEPVLITAEVRKRGVLALKLDREEAEAIVLRGRRILSREPLPDEPSH